MVNLPFHQWGREPSLLWWLWFLDPLAIQQGRTSIDQQVGAAALFLKGCRGLTTNNPLLFPSQWAFPEMRSSPRPLQSNIFTVCTNVPHTGLKTR